MKPAFLPSGRWLRRCAAVAAVSLAGACGGGATWRRPPKAAGPATPLSMFPGAAVPEQRWQAPCDPADPVAALEPALHPAPLFRCRQDLPGCWPVEDGEGRAYTVEQGWLVCRDAHTGERRWAREVISPGAQVLPDGGWVFLYDRGGPGQTGGVSQARLVRLDPATGADLTAAGGLPAMDMALADRGRVCLVSRHACLVVDGHTGASLWRREYRKFGSGDVAILAATVGDGLVALQARLEGRALPDLTTFNGISGAPGWLAIGRPLFIGGGRVVSVNEGGGGCVVRSITDGAIVGGAALEGWIAEKGAAGGSGLIAYVARRREIVPERVSVGPAGPSRQAAEFVAATDLVVADAATGGAAWSWPVRIDDPAFRFFAEGDRLCVVSSAGPTAGAERLGVFDLATGAPLWWAEVPGGVEKVHIRKDRALVRTGGGWVHAVEWAKR